MSINRSSLLGRQRLSEGQHQAICPVEEGGAMDDIGNFEVAEPLVPQSANIVCSKLRRRLRQRDRRRHDRIPAAAEIGVGTLIEQALHIFRPLRMMRSETGMDGGAEYAAIRA